MRSEKVADRLGEWKVVVSTKGETVGTYKFRLLTGERAQAEPRFTKSYPLSILAAAETVRKGRGSEALAYYESLGQESIKLGKTRDAGFAYILAATVALYSGNFHTAVNHSLKSLDIVRNLKGNHEITYQAYLKLVLAFLEIGEFNGARYYANLMMGLASSHTDLQFRERRLADSHWYLARVDGALGNHEGAIANLLRAKGIYEKLIDWSRKGRLIEISNYFYTLSALGEAYLNQGNLQEAKIFFELAIDPHKILGRRVVTVVPRIGLGRIAMLEGDLEEAKYYFRDALRRSRRTGRPFLIARALHGLGQTYMRLGQWKEGVSFLKEAASYVEDMRSSLKVGELRQTFLEGRVSVYRDLVLALRTLGEDSDAFHYAERGKARAFLDVLAAKVALADDERELREKLAALQFIEEDGETGVSGEEVEATKRAYNDFLAKLREENAERASLMTVDPLSLKEVQKLLDAKQILLEYFVADEKTFLWVVGKDSFYGLTIATPRKDLVGRVNSLRKLTSEIGSLREYQRIAAELYDLLIQPALPYVKDKELIIVPHEVLHYVPFQALYSSQGKYLIEDAPVSYLSSASLLQFVKEKRKAKGDLSAVLAQAGKVLAFGNPDLGDPQKDLQFAELEAGEVRRLYPKSSVYVRKEATEEKAKGLSSQYDILHFATHAELKEDDPLSSAVLLAKNGKEDGRLEVREVFGMDLKASLVVLSACETGLGKLSTGDELVGLTRAFIYAGTPSVVASLWKVEDSSTAALMASFYKNLKTMTKVEALRQAQLELIRGQASSDLLARRGVGGIGRLGEVPTGEPQSPTPGPVSISTAHPYFWAPFILVGDGT
ncbi:MAG: CHAT domain-containing protein [Deltaproteobacteria bacterium]|nr:CHAT domain-containing protein [Deltaproteobacteria bacterium]